MPYEPLLDRVVPRLVMEHRLRRSAGSRLRRRGGPPAIEIVVPPGTHGPGLLTELHRRYAHVLPVNDPGVPLGEGPVNCLLYLSTRAGGLGRELPHRRMMGFPRFTLGMLAYSWAERNDRPDLAAIAQAHTWLERELRRELAEDGQRAAGDELYRDVEQVLAGMGRVGGLMAVMSAVGRFSRGRPRADRVALRWWGALLGVPRGGVTPRPDAVATSLFTVHWRGKDTAGHTPVQLLAAAFLADIDAYYTLYRRLNRVRPPVLLLPDAHTPAGRALLDTLLKAHETAFGRRTGRRTVTRPVIVALATGETADLPSVRGIETRLDSWTRRTGVPARERWLLRVAEPGTVAAPPGEAGTGQAGAASGTSGTTR